VNTDTTLLLSLKIDGAAACFRRPEFVDHLVTYDVMPPPVARKVLESIYRPPGAHWQLRRLHVLNRIACEWRDLQTARGRNHALILTDVSYVIDAELIMSPADAIDHRARLGAALNKERHHSHLGLSEFTAQISEIASHDPPISTLAGEGTRDLGWMLYDLEGRGRSRARYFRPMMIDGTIDFIADRSPVLVS
jgi:CRISPR-associated protein Cas5d